MYLLELEALNLSSSEVETLRFSDQGLTSAPDDTPGNAWYEARLAVPASLERRAFSDGVTGGATDGDFGEIELSNPDGGADFLEGYALDGRRFLLLSTETGRVDGAVTVMAGTIEGVEPGMTRTVLRIRDRRAELETPIQPTLYAGTNDGPDGAEGGDDLKGQEKPLCYGRCLNVPLVCVNASVNLYQGHDGQVEAYDAVYDKGLGLTATADYPDLAALVAATFSAGQFATCLVEGFVRTWVTPAGDLTADIRGDASEEGFVSTAAGIVERILRTRGGLGDADLDDESFLALAAAAPQEVGIFIDAGAGRDMDAALDDLCRSVGAWWFFDRLGVFRVGRFQDPATSGVSVAAILDEVDVLDDLERDVPDDVGEGTPIYRVKVEYAKNLTVQDDNRLAGAVTTERREWLAEEFRTETAEDADILAAHPLSPELTVRTLLVDQADAAAEAARLLGLYGVARQRFTVPLKPDVGLGLELGDVVELRLSRCGLSGGRRLAVLGLELDLEDGRVEADLYG